MVSIGYNKKLPPKVVFEQQIEDKMEKLKIQKWLQGFLTAT